LLLNNESRIKIKADCTTTIRNALRDTGHSQTVSQNYKIDRDKLNKDKNIIQLIDHLENRFGLSKFIINDFWDADLCAIGLSDPQKKVLIYISTYGKRQGQYFISIEDIYTPTISNNKPQNVQFKELEIIIASHLKLK